MACLNSWPELVQEILIIVNNVEDNKQLARNDLPFFSYAVLFD